MGGSSLAVPYRSNVQLLLGAVCYTLPAQATRQAEKHTACETVETGQVLLRGRS